MTMIQKFLLVAVALSSTREEPRRKNHLSRTWIQQRRFEFGKYLSFPSLTLLLPRFLSAVPLPPREEGPRKGQIVAVVVVVVVAVAAAVASVPPRRCRASSTLRGWSSQTSRSAAAAAAAAAVRRRRRPCCGWSKKTSKKYVMRTMFVNNSLRKIWLESLYKGCCTVVL